MMRVGDPVNVEDDIEHTFKHPSHGLSSNKASEALVNSINEVVASEERSFSFKRALKASLLTSNNFIIIVTIALLVLAFGLREREAKFSSSHLIFEAVFLLVFWLLNTYLKVRQKLCNFNERIARITAAIDHFIKFGDAMQAEGLHELSASISHATVLRDGRWLDIPAAYLVEDDLVGLCTGEPAPTSMRCVEPGLENVVLQKGQVCTYEYLQVQANIYESGSSHPPQERCCFVVEEPPLQQQLMVEFSHKKAEGKRPDPVLNAISYIRKLVVRMLYVILILSFCANGIRAGLQDKSDLVDLLITRQTNLVLAMALILCPSSILHVVYAGANAKLMAHFEELQLKTQNGGPAFGDNHNPASSFDVEDQKIVTTVPTKKFIKYFGILLRGSHPAIVHSVNLVNTMGSITMFCCVDKDGILSDPVYSIDGIDLLKEKLVTLALHTDDLSAVPSVHFQDAEWKSHLPVLKALGLNCLLNRTCRTAVLAEPSSTDSAKLRFVREREQAQGVATQCICLLGKEIGFADDAFDLFVRLKELHTIAPAAADGQEAPYMISLVVKDTSGTLQLLSKGSAELILSHCTSYWDGGDLRIFRPEDRSKIFHIYNKTIESGGHCIAFAYKNIVSAYNRLFEGANVNSPIVDVRLSRPEISIVPTNSNIDLYTLEVTERETKDEDISVLGNSVSTMTPEVKERKKPKKKKERESPNISADSITPENSAESSAEPKVSRRRLSSKNRKNFNKRGKKRSLKKTGSGTGSVLSSSLMENRVSGTESDGPPSEADDEASKLHLRESLREKKKKRKGKREESDSREETSSSTSSSSSSCSSSGCESDEESKAEESEEMKRRKGKRKSKDGSKSKLKEPEGVLTKADQSFQKEEGPVDEDPTLEKLQADEIFIGMIEMRERPKMNTNIFVDMLREGGIRFVWFSDESRKRSSIFAAKLGLETDWNCCISLKDPCANEPPVQPEPSKLPIGISSIRRHLQEVDNVPLLVPLFCDCRPDEKREMIKILQENGEVVCCMGSALNHENITIFCQADIAIAIEPLMRRCLNEDSTKRDRGPLLSSRYFFDSSSISPCSTQSFCSDITTIPCPLVYHRNTDFTEISELVQHSRQILTNTRHSLLFYTTACAWLALVIFLCGVLSLSLSEKYSGEVGGVPLTGLQVVWLVCVIFPLLSFPLLACPAEPDIMRIMNGKNSPEYEHRGVNKFLGYLAFRTSPSVLLTVALFLWSLQIIWKPSVWPKGDVFGQGMASVVPNNGFDKALLASQNIAMFVAVYYLVFISASFHSHTHTILEFSPLKNLVWLVCSVVAIILQIAFFVISFDHIHGFTYLANTLPWYFYVVLFVWVCVVVLIDEGMKRKYKKWWRSFQLELRLEFDTKLGMHSPIATKKSTGFDSSSLT